MLTAYGSYTLVVRSSMLETLGEDYVLTARAKGLPTRRIVWRHAVRNALLPMITLIALELGFIVGGVLLIEVIFSWPGIGLAMYNAIGERDYPMLQGGFPDPRHLGDRAELHRRSGLLPPRPEDHPDDAAYG
jgi:peptide/nickel transport system permease protein